MSPKPEEVVFALLKSGESGDAATREAFHEHMAEDITWVQSGLPTCHGLDECLALWDKFSAVTGCVTWPVEITGWAVRDDTVFVERIDHILDEHGGTIFDVPIVGVFRLRDDKIVEWYEYLDPTPFAAAYASPTA
ncbi:MAG TPA: limonene-1,2-epoxide hydrolase family protein [Pseudonocardiaceae bacterium]|nr:limonene-1,2-epoxide hydrolase family protein [Pseudonocardiaceae bacterium]